MNLSKSITDIVYTDAHNGDLDHKTVTLEKSKTFPEIKDKRFGYYVTKLEAEDKEAGAVPSDVKVLYLYKEKGIGTESEVILESDSIALQTREVRTASMNSVVRKLMCCFSRKDD